MTNELESLIKQLGDETFSQVDAEVGSGKWSTTYVDARFNKEERSWVEKTRVHDAAGSAVSISSSNAMSLNLIYLQTHRGTGAQEWYGILLTIWPDRRCVVKLNYDANCATDDTFYDT